MLRALYLDLNSFFASCEQQLQPQLRGRPVAVVPSHTDTTFVIAASYEAKAFGVRTGTRVGEAKKMCPGLVCVAAGHGRYVEFHHKIKDVVETVIPVHAVRSVDEFACELTGSQQQQEKAVLLAKAIKQEINDKVGVAIKASIGIAPNFLLAKIATDMQKPDGLTILKMDTMQERLLALELQDIPGIGRRMFARLNNKGIFTMQDLLACTPEQARGVWGSLYGGQMLRMLKGDWIDYRKPVPPKSVGHEHVLPPRQRSFQAAKLVGHKLLWKAAIRLRRHQRMARKMYVSIRYTDRDKFSKELRLPTATQDSSLLLREFNHIYKQSPRQKKPLKVSITLYDLCDQNEEQLSLFGKSKGNEIYRTVDAINEKFGRDTIYAGTLHNQLKSAPTRIAFSRIPERDEVDSKVDSRVDEAPSRSK